MPRITKHRVVLQKDESRFSEREETVWFISPDQDGDLYEDLLMDWDVWTQMGRPVVITMSVVAGDILNEPEPKLSDVQDNIGGSPIEH